MFADFILILLLQRVPNPTHAEVARTPNQQITKCLPNPHAHRFDGVVNFPDPTIVTLDKDLPH